MLFPKISLILGLVSYILASPQIVITRTNTEIVTVTPQPSSTSTVYVTVTKTSTIISTTKKSTTKKSTTTGKSSSVVIVTITKTVTAGPPSTTKKPTTTTSTIPCPAPLYYPCGGGADYTGCKKCRDATATCYSQNPWYWQCIDKTSVPLPTEDARA